VTSRTRTYIHDAADSGLAAHGRQLWQGHRTGVHARSAISQRGPRVDGITYWTYRRAVSTLTDYARDRTVKVSAVLDSHMPRIPLAEAIITIG
jgi:hypothetical protein